MYFSKLLKQRKGIYMWIIGPHRYVGSSVNLYKRLRRHYSSLCSNTHDNEYFQRSFNKYSERQLRYTILEICNPNISTLELLKREKYYIEYENADLNLKLDPVTQQNCITISKLIYQFNQFGELLKQWPSIEEASRYYNINGSNIVVAAKRPQRQRMVKGFLWSYEKVYPYSLHIIYVFDKDKNYLSKHINTVDVYETYFSHLNRKNTLSMLKPKIDSGMLFNGYYFSSSLDLKVKELSNLRFNSKYIQLKQSNPLITFTNELGKSLRSKHFNDYRNKSNIFIKLLASNSDLSLPEIKVIQTPPKRSPEIIVFNKEQTQVIGKYKTVLEAVYNVLNTDSNRIIQQCRYHISRETIYKNYYFLYGTSIKSSELLERLEGTKTKTELETVNGKV